MPHSRARLPSPLPALGQRSRRAPRPPHAQGPAGTSRSPGDLVPRGGKRPARPAGFLTPCSQPAVPITEQRGRGGGFQPHSDTGRSAPNSPQCPAEAGCPGRGVLLRPVGRTAPFRPACSRAGLGGLFHCSGVQAVLCPGGKSLFLPSPLLPLLGKCCGFFSFVF